MKKILKKLYNQRLFKNIRNYFRTKKLLGKGFGQIDFKTDEGNLLFEFIKKNKFETIFEIGTWNGLGSTKTIIEAIKMTNRNVDFFSLETDKIAYKNAVKNLYEDKAYVNLLYGRILEIDDLPNLSDIDFESFGFDPKNEEWYIQDIRRYKKTKNIFHELPLQYDFILFDGGEFSTFPEFLKLWSKTKYFALDDTETYKQYDVLKFIKKNNNNFEILEEVKNFQIYKVIN